MSFVNLYKGSSKYAVSGHWSFIAVFSTTFKYVKNV